jgi:hypothetical protein
MSAIDDDSSDVEADGGMGFNFGMMLCGTISVTWRTVRLVRLADLKGLGTLPGLRVPAISVGVGRQQAVQPDHALQGRAWR